MYSLPQLSQQQVQRDPYRVDPACFEIQGM